MNFDHIFDYTGYATRAQWWTGMLWYLIGGGISYFMATLNIFIVSLIAYFIDLSFLIMIVTLCIRRFRDTGLKIYLCWLALIPVIGWGFVLYVDMVLPSVPHPKKVNPFANQRF